MIQKYEFTGEEKSLNGRILKRIRRISDGLVGGWIEKEDNLSHFGSCFVSDNACVYDHACVFGSACVSDNARVFGDMVCTQPVMYARLYRHIVTCSDSHISVGCQVHAFDVWKERGLEIAKEDGRSDTEIELYKGIVLSMISYREATNQKV